MTDKYTLCITATSGNFHDFISRLVKADRENEALT
jgi:hypothetical protein